jgi:hypothetical protein
MTTVFEELPPAISTPYGNGSTIWTANFLATGPEGGVAACTVKAIVHQDKASDIRLKQEQRGNLMCGMLIDARGVVYGISSVYVGAPPESTEPTHFDGLQPTAEQCSTNAEIRDADGRLFGYACWYPQTGGYSGRALAMVDPDGCLDVLVWHDGQFPFDGECQNCREPRPPVELHHCDGEEFVRFGQFLMGLNGPAT